MLSSHAAGTNAKRVRCAREGTWEVLRTSALWHALPRALPAAEALATLPVLAVAASERASSVDTVLPEVARAQRAHSIPMPPERASALATIVDMLEGQAVRVEERGIEGAPGYYRRLCVTCAFHTLPGNLPCRAHRNTGARQTARLGVQEPLVHFGDADR